MKKFILMNLFYFSSVFAQSIPPSVETRLGKLEFPLGVPALKTVETLYDHLDYIHGINTFLTAFSGVSTWAMREGFLKGGVKDNEVLIFSKLMDAKSLFLTANADTINFYSFLDLSKGPLVIEMPSQTEGFLNDMWQRWIIDLGFSEKVLLVPPEYKNDLPKGYTIAKARTTRVLFFGHAFLDKNDPQSVVEQIKERLNIYSYPGPGETKFIEGSSLSLNTIPPPDFSFYQMLDALVQDQPATALDPEIAGNFAAIGILKGKVFQPDEHLKSTLSASSIHGNAVSRVLVFRPRAQEDFNYYGSSSHWLNPLFGGGFDFLTEDKGARRLDAKTAYFYIATGINNLFGKDLQYLAAFLDSQNQPLDGAKSYRLTLPAKIPAGHLWSITLYDNQTRSLLDTPQKYPKVGSPSAMADSNGMTTIYFGPGLAQNVQTENWIQTQPGQGYFAILRLYSPLASFFDKTWKPGEIEEIKTMVGPEGLKSEDMRLRLFGSSSSLSKTISQGLHEQRLLQMQ